MTLSLGAVFTGSSLIIMIWSPGISFPSEGPPGNTSTDYILLYNLFVMQML